MKVRELLMYEMSPFHDVKRRPFEFNPNMLAMDEFIRVTNGGQTISTGALHSLGAGVLKQRAMPEPTSVIENGWQSRRWNFILEIEHDVAMSPNSKIVQYLSGYTDETFNVNGFTTNRIDLPSNLMFRFTNNITVTETRGTDSFGRPVVRALPTDAFTLLYGNYDPQRNDVEYSTRVQDALAYSSTARWIGSDLDSSRTSENMNTLMKAFGPADATIIRDDAPTSSTGGIRGVDGSVSFATDKVKQAHASTALPTTYLQKAFGGIALARSVSKVGSATNPVYEDRGSDYRPGGGGEMDHLLSFAAQDVREDSVVRDRTLGRFMRDLNLDFNGTIDWHTMKSMFGTRLDEVTRVIPFAQAQRQRNEERHRATDTAAGELGWNPMDSQGWGAIDHETLFASSLSAMLPAAMMERLVERVRFVADNYGRPDLGIRPGEWAISINDCHSYINGYDKNIAANQMLSALQTTVLPSMMAADKVPCAITCGADLFVETQFKITVNGGHPVPYTMPTFAPCAMSPLMTRDLNQVHKLATDLVNVAAMVTDVGNF